ncbi:hypothetical protein LV89_03138 [Arcicella aurantiaca]|uniref:Uncharacterized protein n=1 Tax=Arcicella aurantiaca TaxID=591202 RepID=A0A316DYY1_9BACT|nr:hypothetical protein [Arcicella aurantiaca]PWK23321.1 hypothetical protein LV89_03138 [Arcicella aurantiaca]
MKYNPQKYFSLLLIIAPILFFVFYVWQYTINVPFLDDSLYYTKCLVDVEKSNSAVDSFWIFMKQHTITEHRTPISKFTAWLIYKFTGKFDYVILAHLGNLALFGMLFLFWRFFKKHGWSLLYFTPIPFLIFQMQTYENQFWTICNWTYYPIGLLQMVVLYFLSYQKRNNLLYAIITAILVTFTFSNGMFVFLPVGLLLIYQKRYKALGLFIIVGIACVALYFSNYKPSPIAPHEFSLTHLLGGFVLMLGAYVDVQGLHKFSAVTSSIFGMIILSLMTWGGITLLKDYFESEEIPNKNTENKDFQFIISSMIVLCMSAGAVAYSRYSGEFGFEEMFVSRYRFISVTLLCLAYSFVLLLIKKDSIKRLILTFFLPITAFLYIYSYYYIHEYNVNFREKLVAATYNFKHHNSWVLYPFDNDWTYQVDVENVAAIKMGIYQLPTLPFTAFQEAINKDSVQNVRNLPLTLEENKDRFVLKNETLNVENPLIVEQNVVLKSKRNTYLLPLKRQRNKSRRDYLFHQNYFWKGFETDILKNTFIPDEYTIGLLKIQDGKYNIQYSNLKLKL